MAHNLENVNGKTSFASTEKAWHGLGQIVDGAMTSEQAIELANLDYTVETKPLFAQIECGGVKDLMVAVPDKFATIRTDNNAVLGVVGNRYTVVQNRNAFAFFDAIVGQGQAIFETAGVLGIGERIFITAKLPNYIRIANTDDITETYAILTSSHDGSGAVICALTNVRIVCQNTLRAALKSTTGKIAIRHTTNVEANLAQAHKFLGISNEYNKQANEMFNSLALKTVTDAKVKELVEKLFPSESKNSTRIDNIREAVLNSYYAGVGQSKIIGTAWGVYNGITHYVSHVQGYKNEDVKFDSLMDGASSKLNNQALELLLAL